MLNSMTLVTLRKTSLVCALLSMSACGAMKNLDDMHTDMQTLVGEIKTMSSQMTDMNADLTTMSAKMTDVDASTQKMSGQMTGMGTDIHTMVGQMNGMSTNLVDMNSKLTDMSTKMAMLATMNATMTDMSTKMDQLSSMNATMTSMSSKMDQLTSMNKTMTDMSGKMDMLVTMNATMQTMGSKLDSMNTTMQAMGTQMSVLTTMNNTMTDMSKNLLLMNATMQAMGAQMSVLTEMNATMKTMGSKLDTMNTTMNGMSSQMSLMSDMKKSIDAMGDKMALLVTMNDTMVALSAKLDALKTMNDNIVKMAAQMTDLDSHIVVMSDQLGNMSGDIKGMSTTLTITHGELTTAAAAMLQIDILKQLESSPDYTSKLGYAAEFMIAQEYQSWNGKIETVDQRYTMMDRSLADFMNKIHNYIKDENSTDPAKADNASENLYALSAALDYVNSVQLTGIAGTNEKSMSVLGMLENCIVSSGLVDSGKLKLTELPAYENTMITQGQVKEAIYLLKVRQNFLQIMAFSVLTEKDDGDRQSKLTSMMDFIKGRYLGMHYDSKVDLRNVGELNLITSLLNGAADTADFLKSQGIDPGTSDKTRVLLTKMNLPAQTADIQSKTGYSDFTKALNRVTAIDNGR